MSLALKSIEYCVLSAFMVVSAEARAAARFVVAERGTPPQTTIWCSNVGLEVEKYAANELRDYVRRITGVELPVSIESKRPSGRVIQLSSGEFADDGFELAVKGETLRVRGGRRAGVCSVWKSRVSRADFAVRAAPTSSARCIRNGLMPHGGTSCGTSPVLSSSRCLTKGIRRSPSASSPG